MHKLYTLKEKLCEELEAYADKELNTSNLEVVDTPTHTLKNLNKIIEAEGGEEYSTRRYSYGGNDHMNTNNYMDRHSYDYRGMYSRADDVSSMIREIRQLGEYLPASKQVDVERLINRLERV